MTERPPSPTDTVTVDAGLCVGSGQCELYCPTVFVVVDGLARVREPHPPADLRDDVRDAADACPTQAIAVGTPAAP